MSERENEGKFVAVNILEQPFQIKNNLNRVMAQFIEQLGIICVKRDVTIFFVSCIFVAEISEIA